jgi:hypothetical protein
VNCTCRYSVLHHSCPVAFHLPWSTLFGCYTFLATLHLLIKCLLEASVCFILKIYHCSTLKFFSEEKWWRILTVESVGYIAIFCCTFSEVCGMTSRWCSGKHVCHWTQGSRVQTRPRTMDFKGGKIRSMPSFGGEVKPLVPCRRFTACKRTLRAR